MFQRGATIMCGMWNIMCFLNFKPRKHIALHQIHQIMFFLETSYEPLDRAGQFFSFVSVLLSQVVLVRWNEPFQKLATCDTDGGIFVWIQYEGRWSVELVNDRGAQVRRPKAALKENKHLLIIYSPSCRPRCSCLSSVAKK